MATALLILFSLAAISLLGVHMRLRKAYGWVHEKELAFPWWLACSEAPWRGDMTGQLWGTIIVPSDLPPPLPIVTLRFLDGGVARIVVEDEAYAALSVGQTVQMTYRQVLFWRFIVTYTPVPAG